MSASLPTWLRSTIARGEETRRASQSAGATGGPENTSAASLSYEDRLNGGTTTGPGYNPWRGNIHNPMYTIFESPRDSSGNLDWQTDLGNNIEQFDISPDDYYREGLTFDYAQANRNPWDPQEMVPSGFNTGRTGFNPGHAAMGTSTYGQGLDFYYTGIEPQERGELNQLIAAAFGMKRPSTGWDFMDPLDNRFADNWSTALEQSIAYGIPVMELLRQRAEANTAAGWNGGGGGGGGGSGPKRPTVQIISDEDAEELLNQTAISTIGRKLSVEEKAVMRAMTKAIQSKQAAEQNALIDQQMAGGGQAQSPTSPQTLAGNEVEEEFEIEAGAKQMADGWAQMIQMLTRPGGF